MSIRIRGNCLVAVTNSDAIRRCALSSVGNALLPDWWVDQDIAAGSLIRFLDKYDGTARDYESANWPVHSLREYTPLKSQVFTELLAKRIGKSV